MPKHQNFVIGTAGHIDHGKTTLVKALTGMDPDRLAEEKKRGITIDLGFAHYTNEQGIQFSFVDVPGHEKFVHNMLAGAAGIDAIILVVAADEGVMPQTREHLDICQLLQIPSGIIALTRSDLVEDPEMIELCQEEIEEMVVDTFLENAPIIPVSSHTGVGLDKLGQALVDLLKTLQPRDMEKAFRFMVDRSFSIKGFGTVVTGTMLSGQLDKDAEVFQYPPNEPLRIRGLQVHGKEVTTASAGQRVAINLAQISKDAIVRGDQIAKRETLINSYMLNVELHLLETTSKPLKHRDRIRLYLGTREVMGRAFPLEAKEIEPGHTQLVQLRLETPVSSRFGDRFIIRSFSPIRTLGGGRILDPFPSKTRRIRSELVDRLKIILNGDQSQQIDQVVYLQSIRGVFAHELNPRTGLSEKQLQKVIQTLASQHKVFCVDPQTKRYLHGDHVTRISNFIKRLLKTFHEKYPEREGMNKAELTGKLRLVFSSEREVENLLNYLVKTKILAENNKYYHLPGHEKSFSSDQQTYLETCVKLVESAGFQPPRRTVLIEQLGIEEKEGMAIIKMATHNQALVKVSEDLFYTPQQIETLVDHVYDHFEKQTELTVIDFKEQLQIGRKHAVELLEYFDSKKVTMRVENHRILRTPRKGSL